MENASKALIIAGAILLSILLISLGIMVYNNAKNTVGSANLDAQTIQAFNSQWESYKGTNKSASDVKAMASAVRANNAAENKSGTKRYIAVTSGSQAITKVAPTDIPNIPDVGSPRESATYTISLAYDDTTGLVIGIHYKAN